MLLSFKPSRLATGGLPLDDIPTRREGRGHHITWRAVLALGCAASALLFPAAGNASPATPAAANSSAWSPAVGPNLSKPSIAADDYDTWCEHAPICHRKPWGGNNYISEAKANLAYLDDRGRVIAKIDVIIRTNLNGRSARWTVTLIWDSGPAVKFSELGIHCREDASGPDSGCGDSSLGSPYVRSRWNSRRVQGNRLRHSNEYFGEVRAWAAPDGYPFARVIVQSARFNCYGSNDPCYFP